MVRVLLIEDQRSHAHLVGGLLSQAGTGAEEFQLECVSTLQHGLERLQGGPIDAVLLDLFLPDSRGLETFTSLRGCSGVPVVILSRLGEIEQARQAVRAGAEDFLVKGQFNADLLARSVLYAVERHRRQQVQSRLDAADRELEAARAVQRRLMPAEPPAVPGLEIAGRYWPADRVGGDYFDYFLTGQRLELVIADVSGHGLSAALIMAGLRQLVRSTGSLGHDVSRILLVVNRALCADTEPHRFVTAFCGSLDLQTRELTYVGAGHRGYVVQDSGEVVTLEATDLPLGLFRDAAMPAGEPIVLRPDNLLVLLTDGFYEVQDDAGRLLGVEAVLAHVHQNRHRPAPEIVGDCYASVCRHRGSGPVTDDMAMVVVKVVPEGDGRG